MSDDLISREEALERLQILKKFNTAEIIQDVIDAAEQQINFCSTAFDKEKVIEEIRERVSDCYLEYCGKYNNCLQCRADEAVKIVEKGGIE